MVTEPGRGHIETLALERGVTLLFHTHNEALTLSGDVVAETRKKIFDELGDGYRLGISGDFAGHKKVRVVANGKIARIYPVKDSA